MWKADLRGKFHQRGPTIFGHTPAILNHIENFHITNHQQNDKLVYTGSSDSTSSKVLRLWKPRLISICIVTNWWKMHASELRVESHLDVGRRAMAVICSSRAAFCQIDGESMLAPEGGARNIHRISLPETGRLIFRLPRGDYVLISNHKSGLG